MKRFSIVLILSCLLGLVMSSHSDSLGANGIQEITVGNTYAPSIVELSDGRLLAVVGGKDQGIWGKYSSDNGTTWSQEFSIKNSTVEYEDGRLISGYLAVSGSVLKVNDKITIFYYRYVSWKPYKHCTIWKLESYDNGQTWVNDLRIDSGMHPYVLSSYKAIETRSGRLILPISWWWKSVELNPDFWRSGVLFSDDNGETWLEGGQIPDWNSSNNGLDEPSIVELSNASLYCILRTYGYGENRVHGYSISNDNGLTWSDVEKIDIMYSFNTTPAVLRYSWNPNIVLVAWINRTDGRDQQDRRPMVVAYSNDDCATWHGMKIIDNGIENKSIIDLRFAFVNDYVFLGYHRYVDFNVSGLSESMFKRFTLAFFADRDSLVQAFESTSDDGNWNPIVDLNFDGTVNILDAIFFSRN